jgi:hypothetical protein
MESLILPGSQINRLAEALGFTEGLKTALGRISNQTAVRNAVLDAFLPLASNSVAAFNAQSLPSAGFLNRPFHNYAAHYAARNVPFYPGLVHQYVAAMLGRCMNAQHTSSVIQNSAAALQAAGINVSLDPNASFDVQLSQIMQGFMTNLNQAIQQKLNEMFPPPVMPKKRKKKGGIGKKLKKGLKKFKKVAKSVGKIGKNMFKGVVGGVKGLFKGNFLKNIFKLGTGLLGGLVGGPIGSTFISQIAQVGIGKLLGKKKAAKLNQIFGQMNKMFGVVSNIQKMNAFPNAGISGFIRA